MFVCLENIFLLDELLLIKKLQIHEMKKWSFILKIKNRRVLNETETFKPFYERLKYSIYKIEDYIPNRKLRNCKIVYFFTNNILPSNGYPFKIVYIFHF